MGEIIVSKILQAREGFKRLKVPMSPIFLSFQVKVHIEKGTSAKKFFDLNKTRIFYEFLKPTFVWFTPSADRKARAHHVT